MQRTKIDWVKNPDGSQGYTWNPITGCLGVNGTPCSYCYARKLANTRLKERYLANKNLSYDYLELLKAFNRNSLEPFQDPFFPRFWPEKLKISFGIKPKGIFACNMSDLFGIGVPAEWTRTVLEKISLPWNRKHRFYLLTKQPQHLAEFSPFPENCWVGVTAMNLEQYDKALFRLNNITAKVKYLSLEPLLEDVKPSALDYQYQVSGISWIIIGGVTGCPSLPQPKIEWVESIVKAADQAGVKVWLKKSLQFILPKEKLFWQGMADPLGRASTLYYKLRQELPEAKP